MKYTLFILIVLFSLNVTAQDAQWRGPHRNGVFPDKGLMKVWPENGPELLYMTKGIGKGNSSAVGTEEAVFVTGLIDSMDVLFCIDHSGKIKWQKAFGPGWDQSFPETRCTPLVDGNRVYVLSGKDKLLCAHASNGKTIWEVDIHETYNSVWDIFGVSESPLLVDDKIIVTHGGEETTVLALDKMTGELIWKSESLGLERSNGSPVLFSNDTMGLEFIVAMNRTHVLGVDPNDGEILWTHPYNFLDKNGDNTTILANSPLFHYDEILISNGWDFNSIMLEVAPDGKSVTEKYVDNTLDNQNQGLVRIGDFVYGSNFLTRHFGKWVCMRWENGEIMWVEEWETKGPIIAADGLFFLQDERKGNISLVKADENNFEVVSSFKISEGRGPYWARPAIYDGRLYVRHGEFLMVYNLKS
jgi:outer membrane protein assembly factor BamB